jgi:hypothetical protein
MCLWQLNMQIRIAIIEKSIFHVFSANIACNCTNKVSRPMFSWSTIIKCSMSLACYANSNVPALPKMWLFRCYQANIACKLRGFLRASTYEISCCFCDQKLIWRSIQGILNKEIPLSSFTNSFKGKQQARMTFLSSRALTSHGLYYYNY